jgi:sulfate/thiosulfate transport system substrate-binding protein
MLLMKTQWLNTLALLALAAAATLLVIQNFDFNKTHELLNVSYAPTGDLYQEIDERFAAEYEKQSGIRLRIKQSHGDSSRQAKAVQKGSADRRP